DGFYSQSAVDIDGNTVSFEKYKHLTELNCKQLQELYTKHQGRGFRILAFPSSQFETQSVIKQNLIEKYGASFDMFSKVDVNGENASPLYKYLQSALADPVHEEITWNFAKFLIDRHGKPYKRYMPDVAPIVSPSDLLQFL
uniref:Glutathione peroxidase n=1 Tax=Mesocestoides corti TaxID=53468 RepID=A0A5K3FLL2_MESCO